MNKLPQINLYFWLMKICATTLGETGGDLFSMTMKIGYAYSSIIFITFFLATLVAQLFSTRYIPLLYWSVILSTSTAGTTISDFMDRTLALGYAEGSLILVTILICMLLTWRFTTGSLEVKYVTSTKMELFYWFTILFSNTLGTALGDFLADNSGLGFAGGALLIGSILAAITLASFYTNISRILLFWLAFILTRPFGATFGDFLTKAKNGLDFGTINSSLILATLLISLIMYTSLALNKPTPKNIAVAEELPEESES